MEPVVPALEAGPAASRRAPRDPEHHVLVTLDERSERIGVAAAAARHELGVGGRVRAQSSLSGGSPSELSIIVVRMVRTPPSGGGSISSAYIVSWMHSRTAGSLIVVPASTIALVPTIPPTDGSPSSVNSSSTLPPIRGSPSRPAA